jgi:hypothetical protein
MAHTCNNFGGGEMKKILIVLISLIIALTIVGSVFISLYSAQAKETARLEKCLEREKAKLLISEFHAGADRIKKYGLKEDKVALKQEIAGLEAYIKDEKISTDLLVRILDLCLSYIYTTQRIMDNNGVVYPDFNAEIEALLLRVLTEGVDFEE